MNVEKLANKHRLIPHESHGGEIFNGEPQINPETLIDFSTNINDFICEDFIKATILQSIKIIPRYPDSNSSDLKKALKNYLKNAIDEKNLIVGAGSMALITTFCDMFLAPGDEVIIPHPTFSEYQWAAERNGAKIITQFRQASQNFRADSDAIIKLFSPKTKVVFLCNPNNPNGFLDAASDIEKIIKIALKNNILVFLDETFIEFAGEQNSFIPKIHVYDNLFICRTFTKFFGLTGLRVGFGAGSPILLEVLRKGQELWSVNCIGQYVAQEILKKTDFIAKSVQFYDKERQDFTEKLRDIPGLVVYPSKTNYVLLQTKETRLNAKELKRRLLIEGFLIRDCSNYPGLDENYVRVAIRTRELNIRLLGALKKVILSR